MKFTKCLFIICIILYTFPLHSQNIIENELVSKVNATLPVLCLQNNRFQNELKKWDNFLSGYGYSNKEEQMAIKEYQSHYIKAYNDLNNKTGELFKLEKSNTPAQWFYGLQEEYGKDYIYENNKNIKKILLYINLKNSNQFLIKEKKELLYRELLYRKSLKRYFDLFLTFYNSLSQEEKVKMKDMYAKVSGISTKVNDNSVGSIVIINDIGSTGIPLQKARIYNHVDKKLIKYLVEHPSLQKPFDYMKTIENFKKIMPSGIKH